MATMNCAPGDDLRAGRCSAATLRDGVLRRGSAALSRGQGDATPAALPRTVGAPGGPAWRRFGEVVAWLSSPPCWQLGAPRRHGRGDARRPGTATPDGDASAGGLHVSPDAAHGLEHSRGLSRQYLLYGVAAPPEPSLAGAGHRARGSAGVRYSWRGGRKTGRMVGAP